MDDESVYSDEEVRAAAEAAVWGIRNASRLFVPYLFKEPAWGKPLAWLADVDKSLEPEALTVKQKRLVIEIVGEAWDHVGADNEDTVKHFKEERERNMRNWCLPRREQKMSFSPEEIKWLKK